MAITYSGTLATDLDRVRFYIQDTVDSAGPKPADANFTDNEITGLLTAEGSWRGAVAAAFEALEAAWRRYPTFSADGLSINRSGIADGYAAKAKEWRRKIGIGVTASSAAMTRVDGYSDDVASDTI